MKDSPLNAPEGPLRSMLLIVVGIALLALSIRMAVQGGLTLVVPAHFSEQERSVAPTLAAGAFISVFYQLLANLPLLLALWCGAAGYGWLINTRIRQGGGLVLQTGIGMAAMLLANWLLAWAGGLNQITAWLLPLIGTGLLLWSVRARLFGGPAGAPRLPWSIIIAMPALGLLLTACACPPGTLWSVEAWGYDVLSYHLQLPREWLAAGRMSGLHHNVYSYLPSLGETLYMLIGAAGGSMYGGIYASQLFHASLALYTALALAALVARYSDMTAGILVGAVFLAVPWVIVTGSLAYNEMFAAAFGAAALLAIFDPKRTLTPKDAAIAGALVGCATLAKLTAGVMFALPVGLILLLPGRMRFGETCRSATTAAIAGLLTLSPYLVRNTLDTGNPVFPLATGVFATGHWDQDLAARWRKGHHVEATHGERLKSLDYQWLRNTGYGAVAGRQRVRESAEQESRNIARFHTEYGVPLLWLWVAAGTSAALLSRATRRVGVGLLIMIAVQLVIWLGFTHFQSRFLIPTLVPGCVLLGLGAANISRPSLRGIVGATLALALTLLSFTVFFRQTLRFTGEQFMPYQIIDSLPREDRLESPQNLDNDHPINRLPHDSKTLLVADNARLLTLRRPLVYHSAFDANPLGDLIRRHPDDPAAVTAALRYQGITHVWVHFSELERLHATYGFDNAVTAPSISVFAAAGWRITWRDPSGVAVLFELPR